uniref:Uncharacterized protein LOC104242524 n=1 Tax=Nicotiana sylvestris TaxID=4096 RepID=A0A1U7Y1R9_NICSY|nr:PREDICTED: uncharacterized protein LOC104242524 [Nicotiana sylvestris]
MYVYPCFVVFIAFPTTIFNENARIPMLSSDNYAEWKEKILLTLGCSDLDLTLRVDEPPIFTESSTPAAKANYERWERSNHLSLMLIKVHISQSIRGSIPNSDKAKVYMKAIDGQFVSSDKALANTLMKRLSSMTFDRSRTVRAHIMEMRDIAAKLKSLEVDMSEPFLVHFILNSLPAEYGPFKISYNTHKDKWSINELLTICVQEEEMLKHEIPESVNMVTHSKRNAKKGKSVFMKKKRTFDKNVCRFCKKKGYWKKDCLKYKKWLEKKGLSNSEEADRK